MAFVVRTLDETGRVISSFDKEYTRIWQTVRVNEGETGFYDLPPTGEYSIAFLADHAGVSVKKVPPDIYRVGRRIHWAPIGPAAWRTGGYLMVIQE